ncbi:hypothetical protein [Lentzea guizhouensis]|nr:hypothetical protein [Lentzea guizhouensis]
MDAPRGVQFLASSVDELLGAFLRDLSAHGLEALPRHGVSLGAGTP